MRTKRKLRSSYALLAWSLGVALSTAGAADVHWTGGAGDGFWTNKNNWSTTKVPGASENALIDLGGTYTVTLNATTAVKNLTVGAATGKQSLAITTGALSVATATAVLGNGVLNLNANFTAGGTGNIQGELNWTGGQLSGPGILTVGASGQMNISGTNAKALAAGVVNQGIITLLTTNFAATSQAAFTNNGLFVIQTNGAVDFAATNSRFVNFATLKKSATGGSAALQVGGVFSNTGTILVEGSDRLELSGSSDAAMTLAAGTTIPGPGMFALTGGSLTADATLNVNGTFELSGGTLHGSPPWTGTGSVNWIGGALNVGTATVASGFSLNLMGSGGKSLSGQLTSDGTINWLGTGALNGSAGARIGNSGILLLQTNCTLGGNGTFMNSGTILRPAASGTNSLNWGTWATTNSGTIQVESNSILRLIGSATASFLDGTVLTGGGTIRLEAPLRGNGTIFVGGAMELFRATIVGDTLWTGPGQLIWNYCQFTSGSSTFASNFQVNVVRNTGLTNAFDAKSVRDHRMTNYGTIDWAPEAVQMEMVTTTTNSLMVNNGVVIVRSDCVWAGSGGFVNNGTILVPSNSGVVTFGAGKFTNSGSLIVETNSTLTTYDYVHYSPPYYPDTISLLTGTIVAGAGSTRLYANSITGGGTIAVDGVLEMHGGPTTGDFLWTGQGTLNWYLPVTLGGHFTFAPGFRCVFANTTPTNQPGPLTVSAFTLTNHGTVVDRKSVV